MSELNAKTNDAYELPEGIYVEQFRAEPADIDVLQHVNNRVYLRWVEEVATRHSAVKGYDAQTYLKMGSVWVAREHWIEYLRPCLLGDEITVYTWVEAVDDSRCLRRYAMKKSGKIVCCAATEWDFISLETRRRTTLPESLKQAFKLIPGDASCLKELGIARPVRFMPVVQQQEKIG